jgi:hypothetical protein
MSAGSPDAARLQGKPLDHTLRTKRLRHDLQPVWLGHNDASDPLKAYEHAQTVTLPLGTIENDSAAESAAKLVQKHLNAVAREKRYRHPSSNRPFRPFVLSLGGLMETEARDALKLWKSIMTGGVDSLLVRRLSLRLLGARARSFEQ